MYLIQILKELKFSEKQIYELASVYDDVSNEELFIKAINKYNSGNDEILSEAFSIADSLSQGKPYKKSTVFLVMLCVFTKHLWELYSEKGYSRELFINTIDEISIKVAECLRDYNELGVGAGVWSTEIFTLNWFRFKRLNFQIFKSEYDYQKSGVNIKKGQTVISVHIPSGRPLIYEECLESYREAAEFFKEYFEGGAVVFYCNSWLVFPDNIKVLEKQSNIIKFASDYDIVDTALSEDGCDFSRIFNCSFKGDYDALPQKTTLQRRMVEMLKKGERFGNGKGYFVMKVPGEIENEYV